MRLWVAFAAVFAALLLASPSLAQEVKIPPSPTQWVTDTAGVLSPDTVSSLNERLRDYERTTGHQVLVWIGATTGDTPLEDWTIKAFTAWKVGRKGLDDGAVLFLFTQDRKVRIEVGYGLEGQLTDAIASLIIRKDVEPQMRANDPDAAVTSAVSDILATIGGENGAAAKPPTESASSGDVGLLTVIILFVCLLIPFIIIMRIARAGGLPYVIGSGWSGSGWGGGFSSGGGGGFSGGGGMGGGGGASGGW